MQRFRRACVFALAVFTAFVWIWSCAGDARAVDVWSGYTKTFTKLSGSDYTLPENQDVLTPNVKLTRANDHGLFNIAYEVSYIDSSPEFTEWATDLNNPGATIAATNYSELTFDTWLNAYGGGGVGVNIIDRNAVVHLTVDDVYLDLRVTSWTNGHESPTGGFSYIRAVPPIVTTGDYNGDHVVNAADYTVWKDTYGMTVDPGMGADGSGNGTIDDPDFTYWKNHFGNLAPGAGAGGVGNAAGVPEPGTLWMVLSTFVWLGLRAAGRGATGCALGANDVSASPCSCRLRFHSLP